MDYRERGSHARGVHPTQDTSRIGKVRMNEIRGSKHQNHSNGVVRNMEERNEGTKGKSQKQGITNIKDLPM